MVFGFGRKHPVSALMEVWGQSCLPGSALAHGTTLMMPIVIRFKILLQKLVSLTAGWGNELEVELAQESRAMLKEMIRAQDIEFPRSIHPGNTEGS